MVAWLPTLITLIGSILAQVGAGEWIAQNPKVSLSLATLAGLINHLLPSPLPPTAPPAANTTLKTIVWVALMSALFIGTAQAQSTVSVDVNKAKLAWDWAPAPAPLDGNPDSFKMKCGKVTAVYTVATPINDPTARTVSIRQVIPSQGIWFCSVFAVNRIGESGGSNEVSFDAGALPATPSNNRVQAQ